MKSLRKSSPETRREFIGKLSKGSIAGLILMFFGCGDKSTSPDNSNEGTGGAQGVVGNNHGHSVSISQTQLDNGAAVTLTLSQGNGHTHAVSLTIDQVERVKNGETVGLTSSTTSAHSHSVTF